MYPLMNNASSMNPYFLPGMPVDNHFYASTASPLGMDPIQVLQQDALIISNLIAGLESLENQIMSYMSALTPQTGDMIPSIPTGAYPYLPLAPYGSIPYEGYPPIGNLPTGMEPTGTEEFPNGEESPGAEPPGEEPPMPMPTSNPEEGVAALSDALNRQDTETVTQLIHQGVDVTGIDAQSGKTLLSIAAATGNAENVKALINAVPKEQQKEYVNQQDAQSGQTALFGAGRSNRKEVVDALIDAGAETDIRDINGTDVYDYVKDEVPNVNAELLKELSPTVTVEGVEGVKIATADMTAEELNTVKGYVKFLSQDPDGSKLLQAASHDKALTISYEPSFKKGMGGDTANHHIRLSKKVVDNEAKAKGDPTDIMGIEALGHELIHAATEGDDDSKQEESLATVVGTRIAGRYFHKPVDEQKVYEDWINGQTNNDAYKNMKVDNNIFADVSHLGIDVSNIRQHAPGHS